MANCVCMESKSPKRHRMILFIILTLSYRMVFQITSPQNVLPAGVSSSSVYNKTLFLCFIHKFYNFIQSKYYLILQGLFFFFQFYGYLTEYHIRAREKRAQFMQFFQIYFYLFSLLFLFLFR